MRYYLSQKKERRITSKLKSLLKGEKKLGLDNFIKLKIFEKKCKKKRVAKSLNSHPVAGKAPAGAIVLTSGPLLSRVRVTSSMRMA